MTFIILIGTLTLSSEPVDAFSKKVVTYGNTKSKTKINGFKVFQGKYKKPMLQANTKAANKINSYFDAIIDNRIKAVSDMAVESYYAGHNKSSFPYIEKGKINLTYYKNNIYSFNEYRYSYIGGAEGWYIYNCYNFNKKTGKKIKNNKLTKYTNKTLKSKIYKATKKKINSNPNRYYDNALKLVKKRKLNNFTCYLSGKYLYVVYNPYDIACWASGRTVVKVKL